MENTLYSLPNQTNIFDPLPSHIDYHTLLWRHFDPSALLPLLVKFKFLRQEIFGIWKWKLVSAPYAFRYKYFLVRSSNSLTTYCIVLYKCLWNPTSTKLWCTLCNFMSLLTSNGQPYEIYVEIRFCESKLQFWTEPRVFKIARSRTVTDI